MWDERGWRVRVSVGWEWVWDERGWRVRVSVG